MRPYLRHDTCKLRRTAIASTGGLDAMPVTLELYAADTGELMASVPIEQAAVNVEKRIIAGIAVPYGVVGRPSVGRAVFRAGSVVVPADQSRVKMLIEHDNNRSVGHMVEHSDYPAALLASFKISAGPAGDQALADAADKSRDGLSVRVECDAFGKLPGDVIEVKAARLREVSLVSIPAYDDARATVLASAPSDEGNMIMARLAEMLDLRASAPTPTDPTPTPPSPPNPPVPGDPQPPAPPSIDYSQLAAALGPQLAALTGVRPEPPAGPPSPPAARGPQTVQAAARVVVDWQNSGGQNVAELMAALSDVVPANDAGQGLGPTRPQWLAELWTASQARRPFVDALGAPRLLTSLKVQGWRWVTRPVVGNYAGNKAAIPSNAVATEPAEATAQRIAGGWDVDRVFVDLGDSSLVTAMFEAATEDYRRKSNTFVGAQLVTAAAGNAAVDADTVPAALIALGAAAGAIGANISFMAVAPDVFGEFATVTNDELPWWVSGSLNVQQGEVSANGMSFWSDPSLASGTYVAGDSRAATFYEQGATPIRVQAINIPNGGVDLAVFGYEAVIVNDDRALFHGEIGGA